MDRSPEPSLQVRPAKMGDLRKTRRATSFIVSKSSTMLRFLSSPTIRMPHHRALLPPKESIHGVRPSATPQPSFAAPFSSRTFLRSRSLSPMASKLSTTSTSLTASAPPARSKMSIPSLSTSASLSAVRSLLRNSTTTSPTAPIRPPTWRSKCPHHPTACHARGRARGLCGPAHLQVSPPRMHRQLQAPLLHPPAPPRQHGMQPPRSRCEQ